MVEPTQQRLAEDLEVDWINLFNKCFEVDKRDAQVLYEAIDVLLVEAETLLRLGSHEQQRIVRARRSLAARKYRSALVEVHPLINGRTRESVRELPSQSSQPGEKNDAVVTKGPGPSQVFS